MQIDPFEDSKSDLEISLTIEEQILRMKYLCIFEYIDWTNICTLEGLIDLIDLCADDHLCTYMNLYFQKSQQ